MKGMFYLGKIRAEDGMFFVSFLLEEERIEYFRRRLWRKFHVSRDLPQQENRKAGNIVLCWDQYGVVPGTEDIFRVSIIMFDDSDERKVLDTVVEFCQENELKLGGMDLPD